MNCPFCKINYDPETLLEGRCPNCSGIVSWTNGQSDDFDDASFSPMVTVSLGPFPNSSPPSPHRKPTSINSDAPKSLGINQPTASPSEKKETSTSGRPESSRLDVADAKAVSKDGETQQSDSGIETDRSDDKMHLQRTITNTNHGSPRDTIRGTEVLESAFGQGKLGRDHGEDLPGNGTDGSLGRNRRMLNSGAVKKIESHVAHGNFSRFWNVVDNQN